MELNAQGRARPEMAKLYNWRYRALGDLPYVSTAPEYRLANAGLAFDYQFINVEDFMGRVREGMWRKGGRSIWRAMVFIFCLIPSRTSPFLSPLIPPL